MSYPARATMTPIKSPPTHGTTRRVHWRGTSDARTVRNFISRTHRVPNRGDQRLTRDRLREHARHAERLGNRTATLNAGKEVRGQGENRRARMPVRYASQHIQPPLPRKGNVDDDEVETVLHRSVARLLF